MKKMITLLFSFALIFVGSVGASDTDKNHNVFIDYTTLNNDGVAAGLESQAHKQAHKQREEAHKQREKYSITSPEYLAAHEEYLAANKKYVAAEEEYLAALGVSVAAHPESQGYEQAHTQRQEVCREYLKDQFGSSEYSSRSQCLQALSEYQAALAARKASGQA